MAHTLEEKKKLLNRVRRIRGQVEAIDRALREDGVQPPPVVADAAKKPVTTPQPPK